MSLNHLSLCKREKFPRLKETLMKGDRKATPECS
jgi:hypothetical protein